LHGHNRADWNFGEEFPRGVLRQSDASVGYWAIGDVTGVHSKIETTQSHEIWHLDMIDRGTMVPLFVGNHKFASLRRITRPAGRTSRVIDWDAIPHESDALHRQRNFDPQLFRRWSATEKNLGGAPVPGLRGNIQR